MRKHFLFLLFLLVSTTMHSQSISIVDLRDHEAIGDVFVITPYETLISNANGKVTLGEKLSNKDSITFQHPSFLTLRFSYSKIQNEKFQVILERKTIALEEFTVSANKWQERADELPLRVSSVHRDALSYQPGTTADLLGNTGQVFIQKSQQGGGSPMFRGFAANRILLVYDGLRVNNAIFRSGNLQNIILFDAKAMESTEIVFGPGSTIYGSDALGGVIEFKSISPTFSNDSTLLISGVASLGFGSAAKEGNGHFHFNIGSDKYASLTSFSYSKFGDLKMGSNGPDDYLRLYYADRINGKDTLIQNGDNERQVPSGYQQFNFIQKFRLKLNDKSTLGFHFNLAQTGDVPRYDRLIQKDDDGLKYAEWYYGPNNWFNAGVSFINEKDNVFFNQWKLNLNYQFYKESRHDRKFDDIEKRNRTETVNGININADFNKVFSSQIKLFYGAEIWYNSIGSKAEIVNIENGESMPTSTRYPNGSEYLNGGIYAMLNWKIDEQWIIKAGLRYNYVVMGGSFDTAYFPFDESEFSQSNQALTPSIGTVFKASQKVRLRANIGQGFRAPNIDDVAKVFDSSPGNVVVPNPELSPEKVWSFDLGFTWLIDENIQLEASGFYSILQDIMVKDDFTINGQDSIMYDGELSKVEAIQNLGDGWIAGVESFIRIALNSNFNITGNIVYTQGEDGMEQSLRHVTPFMSSLHFIYLHRKFKLDLNGAYNAGFSFEEMAPSEVDKSYIYAKDDQGNPYAPSYFVLSLNGSWFISSVLRLDLSLENLLDQRYRPYSSGISAAGFNVKGSLIANF